MADCDLCNDRGTIYDYSVWGDPCPECDGGKMRMSSRAQIKAGTSGCPLLMFVIVAAIGLTIKIVQRQRAGQ